MVTYNSKSTWESITPMGWSESKLTEYKDDNESLDGIIESTSKHGGVKRVDFSLSGYDKEDVKLYIKSGYIVVLAKKTENNFIEESTTTYTYKLNDLTEDDILSTKYKNGMLYVYLNIKDKEKDNHSDLKEIPIN